MVNLTYGVMQATLGSNVADGAGVLLTTNGTDIIATGADGTVAVYDPGDISWVLTCTALVWLMIPGLGYLYSGLARRKNAAHMLLITLLAMSVISIQWWLIGFSLAFSPTGGSFLGNFHNAAFRNTLDEPAAGANLKIPTIVYAIYEQMFACLVPAIAIGAAAERGRIAPIPIFLFLWTTFVYCPIAHWIWSPTGWAYKWYVYDYAGGGPVEIASGITGLVYSLYLGPRHGYGTEKLNAMRPHNVSHVFIGTVLLWAGWLGFNGGSTFAANIKAALAISCTNLAASMAGFTWLLLDWRLERKWSPVGFATGAIAGLVAITPCAGYVGMPAAALVGFVAAVISNLCTSLKAALRFDDAMDIFAVHAVAGAVGLIMNAFFAQASVAANDGFLMIRGGWLDHYYAQLYKQIAWVAVTTGWTALVTFLIMLVVDHIPGLHFRASLEAELMGLDEADCGEMAYDYAVMDRDLEGLYTPPEAEDQQNGGTEGANDKANGKGHGDDLEKGVSTDVRAAPTGDSTYDEPRPETANGERPH